jgi:N-acylneuraminate cytidylyltransferase
MLVLSAEPNPVVKARCEKLGLACQHGVKDKLGTLVEWLEKNQLKLTNTVYLGNDMNDLECLRAAGCAVLVADAHPDVMHTADIVLSKAGGKGAVREMADLILKSVMGSA